MKKIGDVTSTADKNGEWTNGNVAAGIAPTILDAGWHNSVQREILGVIIAAGLQQDKNNDTQLAEAISKIISGGDYATKTEVNSKLAKDQNGEDIPNKDTFIKNLGLGEAAKRNVGTGVLQIPDMSSFTASLSSAGWQKLPSGLIIQWGSFTTTANSTKQFSFPTAFPVGCVGISITRHQPGSRDAINGSPVSRAEFVVQDYANGNEVFSMIALGY